MQKHFIIICLIILSSCDKRQNIKEKNTQISISKEAESAKIKSATKQETENVASRELPKKSIIINSKYDIKLLFGIWALDQNDPHADFKLTKKSYYIADYDGNGDKNYEINADTLKVYFDDYVGIGIITKVTKDSLKINWDENGITNYVKWKN